MKVNFFYKLVSILAFFIVLKNIPGYSQQQSALSGELKEKIEEQIKLGHSAESNSDFNQALYYYTQAANAYWNVNHYQSAIELFKKAVMMSEKLGNQNGLGVLNTNLGMIYTDLNDFQNAKLYFSKSLEISRRMGRKQDIASGLINLANSLNEQADYNTSVRLLEEAKGIAQELSNTEILRTCYSLLTATYDKIGDRKKSTEYFTLLTVITKRIQQDEVRKKEEAARLMVDNANTKVKETEKVLEKTSNELKQTEEVLQEVEQISSEREMQINLLNKEKELQQAQIRQQQLMRNVYIILIISFLLISGISTYGYFRIRKANILLRQKNIEISRQKDEIEKQAGELKELNALKDRLFSIISHDLRSPLFSLMGMLNMAKDGHFSENEQKEILDELSKNVEYNTELLENLLKWANSQLKGSKVIPVDFDLNEVINNKIELYSKTANQKGIRITNRVNPSTFVHADRDMVELIVRNLLTNAIKFSDFSGEVEISSYKTEGNIEVCVSDRGVGIAQDVLVKLFGNQIVTSRGTKNEKGTGLGLILCKDFVNMNGGSIWVKSEVNTGSKFFFTLPIGIEEDKS